MHWPFLIIVCRQNFGCAIQFKMCFVGKICSLGKTLFYTTVVFPSLSRIIWCLDIPKITATFINNSHMYDCTIDCTIRVVSKMSILPFDFVENGINYNRNCPKDSTGEIRKSQYNSLKILCHYSICLNDK